MMLVDNFKVILVVGLLCAAGLHPTDALKCKKAMEDEECGEGLDTCKIDGTGAGGCVAAGDCTASTELFCCTEENCNDMSNMDMKAKICAVATALKDCAGGAGGDKAAAPAAAGNSTNSTASGMFESYYGGIPIVTLLSASMYYMPLKSFL